MHEGHSRLRRFLTGVLFVAAGLSCTELLEKSGLLDGLSRSLLDSLHRVTRATDSRQVIIVTINDDDYLRIFDRKSPLYPDRVLRLVREIHQFAPRVVGVDLDTEDWPPTLKDKAARLPAHTVWARTFTSDRSAPLRIESLNNVLGTAGDGVCYGLTGMQADSDLTIRQYPAEYRMGETVYLSFPLVVHAFETEPRCRPITDKPKTEERTANNWDEDRLLIRYRGEEHRIFQISAGAVKETAALPSSHPAAQRLTTLLSGRTVLLGGTYAAGRDRYPTPVGMLSGVEILGHTILSAGEPKIRELTATQMRIFDLSLGIALVTLGLYYPRTALLLNVALLILLIPISAILFQSFPFFLNAIPVQISVMLHHLLEHNLEKKLEPSA